MRQNIIFSFRKPLHQQSDVVHNTERYLLHNKLHNRATVTIKFFTLYYLQVCCVFLHFRQEEHWKYANSNTKSRIQCTYPFNSRNNTTISLITYLHSFIHNTFGAHYDTCALPYIWTLLYHICTSYTFLRIKSKRGCESRLCSWSFWYVGHTNVFPLQRLLYFHTTVAWTIHWLTFLK